MKNIQKEWVLGFSLFLPVLALVFPPFLLAVAGLFVVVFGSIHWGFPGGLISFILVFLLFLAALFSPLQYLLIPGMISASLGFVLLGMGLTRRSKDLFFWLEEMDDGESSWEADPFSQEETYRLVTEDIPVLICRFSPDYALTYVNRSFCQFFKEKSSLLIGTSFLELLPEEEQEAVEAQLSQLTPKKPTCSLEQQVMTAEGQIHWQRWIYRGLFHKEGDLQLFHAFGEDMMAHRAAQQQIQEGEDKYRILFEGSHDAIIIINKKGRFLNCNERTLELFALPNKEALFAHPTSAFFPNIQPDGRPSMEALAVSIQEVLKTHKPLRFEWLYRRFNGETFPAEVILTSYHLEDESILYANIRDISHHKKAEETLRKSEKKYRMLSENASDIIWTTDMQLHYTYVSPSTQYLTGYTPEEILSHPIDDFFTPSSLDEAKQVFQEELLNEYSRELNPDRTRTLELEQVCKDGTKVMVETKMTFLRDSQGRPNGILGITRDVSHRKEAEKQIAEKNTLLSLLNHIALEQAGVHHYHGLMETVLNQFQKSTGALLTVFSEYNSEEKILIPRHIKAKQKILQKIMDSGGKKLLHIQTPVPDALYQEITSSTVFFCETGTEVTQGAIPPAISRVLQKASGIHRFIGLGYVAEGELYGTSIIGLGEKQEDPSREFLESFAHITAISLRRLQAERTLASYTKEMEGLYQQLNQEMDKARQVHERLLPRSLPMVEGIDAAAHYQPAQKLGGDFYDMIKVDNKLVLYLSDVSGHGLDGCMLSLFVKHTVKSYLTFSQPEEITPGRIIQYLACQFNEEDYPQEYFICIFLAVLDLETLEMTYTGAGFQDTPYVKMGNGEERQLKSRGLFISNNFPVDLIDISPEQIQLTPMTTLFFTTDGLTEEGVPGTLYRHRLPKVFYQNAQHSPQEIARSVVEDFQEFNQGSLQGKDDITFLVLQVKPEEKTHTLELATDLEALRKLPQTIKGKLVSEDAHSLLICLNELIANAMEHGNQLDEKKRVWVELTVMEEYIEGMVADQGEGFNWREKLDVPLDLEGKNERGRGIAMTQLFSHHLSYNEQGNQVRFRVKKEGKKE